MTIHESKALTCMLARSRPPDAEIATWLAELQAMGGRGRVPRAVKATTPEDTGSTGRLRSLD